MSGIPVNCPACGATNLLDRDVRVAPCWGCGWLIRNDQTANQEKLCQAVAENGQSQ